MNPNKTKFGPLWMMFFSLLLVLDLGCGNKAEKKARHLERAGQYVEKQEFNKAVIEIKDVIQLDPNDDEAYYELAETYLKLRQGNEAFQSFSRSVSINPDNLKAQLKMGQMLLLLKRTEEAREKAELILEKSPENIGAISLLAGVQIQEKDLDLAFKTLNNALSIDPSHFDTQLSLARLHLLRGDLVQAEKAYLKAISLDPTSRASYIELSQLYGNKGTWDKAESQLKKMIQASKSRHRDLQVLARFYESRKQWKNAEKSFLEAVDVSPKEDVAALVNLGGYFARRGFYDKALQAMQKAEKIKKDDLNILGVIAQLHFDFNKLEDAENTVAQILERDKGHVNANFLKGRLCLTKRDFSEALERFDLVLRERPRDAVAHYYRALSLIGKGEDILAQQDLLKAVELDPQMLDTRMILAEIYLHERNEDLARQQIDESLKLAPQDARVLLLLGNLKILEQDIQGAESAFSKAVELNPDSPLGYFRLGLLYNLSGQKGKALKLFQKVLDLNPQDFTALGFMVGIYLQDKKLEEAFQLCEKQKRESSGNASTLAMIEYFEGNIYQAKEDIEEALHSFEMAIETDPNILASYMALARSYGRLGRFNEAIAQYETVLSKSPNYLAGYMALGTIYEQQGNLEKAEAYFRKALEINKDFAPAANNLAWNLAEKGGNIDEALSLAQIAKEKMPKNSTVMDTLGWIYYLKGSYLNAIAELQDSVELAPNNPVINYHLGLAYHKNNQQDEAGTFLKKALELAPDFKGAEEARSILEGKTNE
jgi:tetratricopeptide (TPR) repeat protein